MIIPICTCGHGYMSHENGDTACEIPGCTCTLYVPADPKPPRRPIEPGGPTAPTANTASP